ncbi:MAG TPA: DUF4424 family protein [Bryobacteraceae bacterium]|nr:DUF4424 family protein [Bryobacteraceae bacterium]
MKPALLPLALLLVVATPLLGNWGSDAGGSVASGTFRAYGTSQIEMQSENLTIVLYRDRAKVTVEYVMKNTADAVDVKAGFPCIGVGAPEITCTEIEDYQFTADGKTIPFQTEKGDVKNWRTLFSKEFLEMAATGDDRPCGVCRLSWLTSTVHFDKAASHNIRIQYESVYENSSGGPSDDDYYNNDYFRYLLSTAAAWKGPIQRGKITIQGATVDLKSVTLKPANHFKETPAGLVWEFTNLSPTLADNIEISMNDKFNTVGVYDVENDGAQNSWYSFEGDRYYFDFHGYIAKASSERKGYPVQNIADLNKATAWVADKSGGTDESITLTLAKPAHVDQLGIIPGYTKSKAIYFANNRIKDLEVSVNGGQPVPVSLPDEYISFAPGSKKAYQLIDLGGYTGPAKTITLKVKQVYPGSKYNDTCISELLLRTRLKTKPNVRHAR